jgi:hypothetical protein
MNKIQILILSCCAAWTMSAAAADIDVSKLPAASTKTGLAFTNDILPLFKASCVSCHGANRPRSGLRLDTLEGVLKGTQQGPVLKAGDGTHSQLVKAISQLDSESAMPPKPNARRGGRGFGGGPGGPGGPGGAPGGAPMQPNANGGQTPNMGGAPAGEQGTNAPAMRGGRGFGGPPAKPLTAEEVGLVRAWIDQGAK